MQSFTEELRKLLQKHTCSTEMESHQSQPNDIKGFLKKSLVFDGPSVFRLMPPENQVNSHSEIIPQCACGRLEPKNMGHFLDCSFFMDPKCGSSNDHLKIHAESEENGLAASSASKKSVNVTQNATKLLTEATKHEQTSFCVKLETKLVGQYNSKLRFASPSIFQRAQVVLPDHAVTAPEGTISKPFEAPKSYRVKPSLVLPSHKVQADPRRRSSRVPRILERRPIIDFHGLGLSPTLFYPESPKTFYRHTLVPLQPNQYMSLPWKLDSDYQSRTPILKEAPEEALMETRHISDNVESLLEQDTTADLQRTWQVPPYRSNHVYGAPFCLPNPEQPRPSIDEVFANAQWEEDGVEDAAQDSLEGFGNCISSDTENLTS